jgi:hypothetical protein
MIDWTKPIELIDGRKARLLGEIRNRFGCKRVVAIDDCTDEFLGYFNDAGWPMDSDKVMVRNVPKKPAVAIARMFRHRISRHIEVWRVAPNPDWELIGTAWVVEGQFADGENDT